MRIQTVVLDLSSASKPVTKGENGLSGSPKIPGMDVAVDRAGGEEIGMIGGKVDVGDGSAVTFKRVLNSARVRVISEIEVPDEGAVVSRRHDPIITSGKGRPLDVYNEPWQAVAS